MLREMCKSKIHGATITKTILHYSGSIRIDAALMEAADIVPYERVQIVNLNNGARLETYVVAARRGSGEITLLGPAARTAEVGDRVHILSYCLVEDDEARKWKCRVVKVDEKNRIVKGSDK